MKAQTINKVIREKMKDYLSSIEDRDLRNRVEKDMIVTGGCIASLFLKEKVNDFDLYLSNIKTVYDLTVYYCKQFVKLNEHSFIEPEIRLTYTPLPGETHNYRPIHSLNELPTSISWDKLQRVEIFIRSNGVAGDETVFQDTEEELANELAPPPPIPEKASDKELLRYRPVFLSSNAITLSDKVQIVVRFFGTPEQIHDTYDFVHATNWWTFKDGLVTNKRALEALLAKDLIYRGSKYPFASIFRTRKFIQRGWNCHVGNYVKMGMQLNEFDLTDVDVLEEQLTGVDAAYMNSVIVAVRDVIKNNPDFKYNALYVCEILDRMMSVRKD